MAPPPQVSCFQHTTPAGEREAFSDRPAFRRFFPNIGAIPQQEN